MTPTQEERLIQAVERIVRILEAHIRCSCPPSSDPHLAECVWAILNNVERERP